MAFTRADKQRIIDGYLAASGRNMFVPVEFVDWLAAHPDHEAYPWFFDRSDAELARDARVQLARRWVVGLRITVHDETRPEQPLRLRVQEFPAVVSPLETRWKGGGYQRFDPHDEAALDDLARQGASALEAWLRRYRGVAERRGLDLAAVEDLARRLAGELAA